ncbi:MAG: hypothetical protein JWM83_1408 [Candidatus Angelobacter sp.]|jgi:hypothetical protein|nr:hypothetical protein [Candidatus Angelobacter sp.]
MIVGAFIGVLFLLAAFAAYRLTTRLSERTASDVPLFLQKMEMEALYGAFHPEADEHFRSTLSPKKFRQVQWKRIHLALHYCQILSANAWVFQGWTKHERGQNWDMLEDHLQRTILSLRDACVQCRLSSLMIRVSLRWWLVRMALLPFVPPPSFATLIDRGSSDMISFYETVKAMAEVFSLAYGDDYHQKLMQAL